MRIKWFIAVLFVASGLLAPAQDGGLPKGALVLQFDDGYPSWAGVIAPVLKKYGGTATGFVNNQYIESGRISVEELLALQHDYGWEIGSHGFHHINAPAYAATHGADQWAEQELMPSLESLRASGLDVSSFVFPFNASSPEVEKAALEHVRSFRRSDSIATDTGIRADGSVPGLAIDLAHYQPLRYLKRWIDRTARMNQLLFLYGHKVLPDDQFHAAEIVHIDEDGLTLDPPPALPWTDDLVMAPHIERPIVQGNAPSVMGFDGAHITLEGSAWKADVREGQTVLIGPAYATRLSDFEALMAYAAEKLDFYRLQDVPAQP